jgi:hypothetical protein
VRVGGDLLGAGQLAMSCFLLCSAELMRMRLDKGREERI